MATQRRLESGRFADQFERSYRGGAWHGPALAEAIAGLDAERATRRPIGAAHSILELVAHVAFWIEAARRRMAGEALSGLASGEDWPTASGNASEAWQGAVARLESAHRELLGALTALDDERLDDAVAGSDPTLRGLLLGLLQHNAYHAGQISLLRKSLEAESRK